MNDYRAYYLASRYDLQHHGILGQKWGKKNGPPYPLDAGDYSKEEVQKNYKKSFFKKNSANNKAHFDKTIKEGTVLSTLSYDENRTKDADMFFAAFDKTDKAQYKTMFNKKIKEPLYDKDGNEIGSQSVYKYAINNQAKNDIKVASEDTGAAAFKELYSSSRDFYNFVSDPDRMERIYKLSERQFKGYKEAQEALKKCQDSNYKPSSEDLQKVYRIFNYVIPSTGENSRDAKDVAKQRERLFDSLGKEGYGAILDTNDAMYGGFKANAPVIVFDSSQIVPKNVRRLNVADKAVATASMSVKKLLGM